MALGNIKIFNGQGRLLQLTQNGNIYTTTMHLDKVSVGLTEVGQLFILESCLERVGATGVVDSVAKPFSSIGSLNVTVEGNTAYTLFSVYVEESIPYISTARSAVLPFSVAELYPSLDQNGLQCVVNPNKEPIAVHLAYSPIEEGPAYGVVNIVCADYTIIIDVYSEAEDEDVRFSSMLDNFGKRFNHNDELVLRDSDIDEGLPNWISVNQKRKELLLSGDEIYSNIGSVKGLINALKFFGYQDLTVKEFWLNVRKNDPDNGKLISNELGLDYRMIDAGGYRKTDRIGLFYPINRDTGEFDRFGIPIMEDAFMFTQEEVLIKLFALREKLRTDFLPPYVRITDITGEGIYFANYRVNVWSDKNKHLEVIEGEDIGIKVSQSVGYLQDLRRLVPAEYAAGVKLPIHRFDEYGDTLYTNTVRPYEGGQAYAATAISSLIDSIEIFTKQVRYDYPGMGRENIYDGEEPEVIVGFPVVFECITPSTLWMDLNGVTYANLSKHFTWKNVNLRQQIEIEWKINRVGGGYGFKFRGPAADYTKLPHFLPLEGVYDVQCRLINMDNHFSLKILESAVTVYQKNLEIVAVTKYAESVKTWKDFDFSWRDASGTLAIASKTDYQDPSLPNVLMDTHNYKQQIWKLFADGSTLQDFSVDPTYKSLLGHTTRWNNTDAAWGECKKLSFRETKLHSEYLGGFKLANAQAGDVLSIGGLGSHVIVGLTNDDIAADLNLAIEPGIDRFHYTVQPDGIKADAKISGPYGWNFVKLQKPLVAINTQTWSVPNWLDNAMFKIMDKHVDVPRQDWFLDAPVADIIAGKVHNPQYWIDRGVISAKDGRGSLPSFAGSSSWGDTGMKVYNNPFKSPQHVPVFLIMDNSEIYGKHGIIWTVKKVLADGTETGYLTVVDSSYLILRLKDIATYTIEVELYDSNDNRVKKRMPGFIEIIKG